MPILNWSIRRLYKSAVRPQWADLNRIPRMRTQKGKIQAVLELYPCDLLFVHRDAEKEPYDKRLMEIEGLVSGVSIRHVPVVPVRMTEAWLLGDVAAIRCAAGNPNGSLDLNLPALSSLDRLPDPKQVLHRALVDASGLNTRRKKKLRPESMVHQLAVNIRDFSNLLCLNAFQRLQDRIGEAISAI